MSVMKRPDGYYWIDPADGREYGPFPTLLEAETRMEAADEQALEPGETLGEAEAEIGVADFADPDTGERAEESRPRLEEH